MNEARHDIFRRAELHHGVCPCIQAQLSNSTRPEMATASPRKFVPLAPGHDPTILAKSSSPSADISLTKRAFFAAVVVEEGIYGISQGPGLKMPEDIIANVSI